MDRRTTEIETAQFAADEYLHAGPDGTVYLGHVLGSNLPVELRYASVANQQPDRYAAIERLANVYRLIEHDGFRRLLGSVAVVGVPVWVFEGAPERNLAPRLSLGAMSVQDVCALGERLASSLAAAHTLGFVHGSLGPSAVQLRDDGHAQLDFAWLELGAPTTELDAVCSPSDLEQTSLDSSSDVYSLGMLMRALSLGRAPTPTDDYGLLTPLFQSMTRNERDARPDMSQVAFSLASLAKQDRHSATFPTISHAPTQSAASITGGELDEDLGMRSSLAPGTKLGRFELIAKIGEGGMGEVYRAVDRASGLHAAVKVLRANVALEPDKLKRFRKEARILSALQSPYIARLIEINHVDGIDFIALEFVEGDDLANLLDAASGRMPERDALAIVADVCRGLSEAHACGIVHRDIKPENVMIARPKPGDDASVPRVKLCDFGIARSLQNQSATLAFTQDDRLLGTPAFMSPEQCSGDLLTPATDVYSLGCTLFLLLAGRPPFESEETLKLLLAHTVQAPPKLISVVPEVSEATSQLVARMLEKAPGDRFADASLVLEAIERILRGEPTSITVHPTRPVADPARVVQHVFEWELKSSPAELWPFVSNTDRLNRAVGLPPALFERMSGEDNAPGVVQTSAHNRVAGVDLRWQEHPFEWIEGRRWGVLRVFERGVMRWFTIELELIPKPGGGTRLRYTMTLEPKHFVGRAIVAFEMRGKQRAALGKAFARIDAYASTKIEHTVGEDAFEETEELPERNRIALEHALRKLRADGVKDDVLDALRAFCEHAPAQEVARLRPLAFAKAHALDADRLVDACLRGAHQGMFTLLWDLLCPLCRVPSDFVETLQALKDHGHCPSCNVDYPLDFMQSLELVFRVSPEIRQSETRTFCIGGPAFAPHVVAQVRLAPKERLMLDLALAKGSYKVRSPQLPHATALQISSSGLAHRGSIRMSSRPAGDEARLLLGPGSQALSVENVLDREVVVRIERSAPREDALTAARAACLASFRKLFPGEVLANGRLVAVGHTAFVVTRVHDQRAMMRELGDARAFERVLAVLTALERIVSEEAGAVVKTASGTTLSAFDSASPALRAALALRRHLDHARHELGAALDVRIVVHQGPAVIATFDGRLDYFGSTVENAVDLIALAPAKHVLLSESMAQDPSAVMDLQSMRHSSALLPLGESGAFAMLIRPGAPELD